MEWNYGEYEGLTLGKIHEKAPGWLIFRDGCPRGEAFEQVGKQVDRVIARGLGDVAPFAHGQGTGARGATDRAAFGGGIFCLIREPCAYSTAIATYRPLEPRATVSPAGGGVYGTRIAVRRRRRLAAGYPEAGP